MSEYNDLSKEELLDLAKERDIAGRSGMNKDELREALEADDAGSNDSSDASELEEEYRDYAKDHKDEDRPATGAQSEASDPENPYVADALEDNPAYEDLSDHDKELADLALDASGPLHVESPYERVMTGAVDEDQAKEQEGERGKLPDEYVGDLTEKVSDEDAEQVRKAYAGEFDEVEEEHEPPLEEQFKAREEKYARQYDLNRKDLQKRVEEEENAAPGPRRAWAQNTVLDTTGLGGESDPGKAYNVPELKAKKDDDDGE